MAAAGVKGYARNASSRRSRWAPVKMWYGTRESGWKKDREGWFCVSTSTGSVDWSMPYATKHQAQTECDRRNRGSAYRCNDCGCKAPVTVGRMAANARSYQRLTWQYWTGQKGDTTVLAERTKETADRLARSGATNIRASAPFTANARRARRTLTTRSRLPRLTHAFYYVSWADEHGRHNTVVKKKHLDAWLKYVDTHETGVRRVHVKAMDVPRKPYQNNRGAPFYLVTWTHGGRREGTLVPRAMRKAAVAHLRGMGATALRSRKYKGKLYDENRRRRMGR
jgi:hypothetical protein